MLSLLIRRKKIAKRHRETSGIHEYISYLDFGYGIMGVFVRPNSSNYIIVYIKYV